MLGVCVQGAEAQSGTIWDLQEGLSTNSANKQNSWAAFEDPPKQSSFTSPAPGNHLRQSTDSMFGSTGKTNMRQQDVRSSHPGGESWKSVSPPPPVPSSAFHGPKAFGSLASPNSSSVPQKPDSWVEPTSRVQPAGWAGF